MAEITFGPSGLGDLEFGVINPKIKDHGLWPFVDFFFKCLCKQNFDIPRDYGPDENVMAVISSLEVTNPIKRLAYGRDYLRPFGPR